MWVEVVGALFWVGGSGWGNILGKWELVVVYGTLFWVDGSWWEYVLGG